MGKFNIHDNNDDGSERTHLPKPAEFDTLDQVLKKMPSAPARGPLSKSSREPLTSSDRRFLKRLGIAGW
jgi:hypothetical protein